MEAEDYHDPLLLTGVPYTCAVKGSRDYVFTNVHIHNGISGGHGSSHFVQGKAYDAEVGRGSWCGVGTCVVALVTGKYSVKTQPCVAVSHCAQENILSKGDLVL